MVNSFIPPKGNLSEKLNQKFILAANFQYAPAQTYLKKKRASTSSDNNI